jgi:hypothetical protein
MDVKYYCEGLTPFKPVRHGGNDMAKMFHSKMTRVIGAAAAAASIAAVFVAVAPSIMPAALAQNPPGSTVPPIGGPIADFIANLLAFIRGILDLIFPIFPWNDLR